MTNRIVSGLASATLVIVIFNLAGKGLGFIREILFANFFGMDKEFNLYLVAAILPLTINTVVLNISINYFIPAYHKIKQNSPDKSIEFFNKIFWLFVSGGIIVSFAFYFSADLILSGYIPGATTDELKTTSAIFNLFLITIPITAGISVLISYLQAEYKFKTPAISQVVVNIIFLILLISLNKYIEILTIPIAYIFGLLLQFIYLYRFCPKPAKLNLLRNHDGSKIINGDYSMITFIFLIETIGQLYHLTDRYFYTSVEPGGIAALNYSYTIFLLPVSILSFALTTVLFPRFSETLHKADLSEFRQNLSQSINITILIFIPITIILIFYSDIIIRFVYERGSFVTEDTRMTQAVLKIYSYSLPFYAIYAILNKIYYSSGKLKSLLVLSASGIAIKIFLNFLLVDSLLQQGLAISTVLSYCFFFVLSLLILKNFIGIASIRQYAKTFFILIIAYLQCYFITDTISRNILPDYLEVKILEIILFLALCYFSTLFVLPLALNNIHKLFNEVRSKYFQGKLI